MQRRLDEIKSLQDELKALRAKLATGQAADLAMAAAGGVVVARVDGLAPGDLRDLAIAVRQQPGVDVVVLIGGSATPAVCRWWPPSPGRRGKQAGDLIQDAAKAVGGGGGGKGDIATAGGEEPRGPRRGAAHRRPGRHRRDGSP